MWCLVFCWLCFCWFFLHKSMKQGKEKAGQNLSLKYNDFWIKGNIHISFNAGNILLFLVETMSASNNCRPSSQCSLGNINTDWKNKVLTHCSPFWPTQNYRLWFCLGEPPKCPVLNLSIEWNTEICRFCQNSNYVCLKQYFPYYHLESYFKDIFGVLYTAGCHAGIVELRQKWTWAKKTSWMTLKQWVLPSNGRISHFILL